MITLSIVIFLALVFLGFAIGRCLDYINILIKDPLWLPHHWIAGLIILAIGFFLFKNVLELSIFSFGFGIFISDYKDFSDLKFFMSDKKTKDKWKFWHID